MTFNVTLDLTDHGISFFNTNSTGVEVKNNLHIVIDDIRM